MTIPERLPDPEFTAVGGPIIALDLFAGHGWGVACKRIGIEEHGVEKMPEAVATRSANGMRTICLDVWDFLTNELIDSRDGYGQEAAEAMAAKGVPFREIYKLLIASPPCQTFSMAGSGTGRKALTEVLGLIDSGAYADITRLREFGQTHDPRTALVLTPLACAYRDRPPFVVFEQVPPVLPVWERCAEEMRAWGYSVWVGILSAEQYGVPQTRKRAILIARADGVDAAPPVPTHSRYYSRDPHKLDMGVQKWVSTAEALGWGMTESDMRPSSDAPAQIVTEKARSWSRRPIERGDVEAVRLGMGKGMIERHGPRPGRDIFDPAFTVVGGAGGNSQPGFGWAVRYGDRAGTTAERVTVAEAAALQSYPPDFVWDVPVAKERIVRVWDRHRDWADPDDEGEYHFESRGIQTRPVTKTAQFTQIGNAVPPLLAEAVLRSLLTTDKPIANVDRPTRPAEEK